MQCGAELLDELKYLVTSKHPWRLSNLRTNLARTPEEVVANGNWRQLRKGVCSNVVREGQSEVSDRRPHATDRARNAAARDGEFFATQ